MEPDGPKSKKVINSQMIYLWMSELLSIVITSAVVPVAMVILSSLGDFRAREFDFAVLVIMVVMAALVAIIWIRFWDMTKYFFSPARETHPSGENEKGIPDEVAGPAADVIKCLAVIWILTVISLVGVITAGFMDIKYFSL